jgi:hypothetical protein
MAGKTGRRGGLLMGFKAILMEERRLPADLADFDPVAFNGTSSSANLADVRLIVQSVTHLRDLRCSV